MRLILVVALAVLLAPQAGAFHAECPAASTTLTLRVDEGGFYVANAGVYEETNGHSGLQMGELPAGCTPDRQVA